MYFLNFDFMDSYISIQIMKIYTKTGDQGETSLFTGKRVSKGHHLINIFGFLDELNTTVGQLCESVKEVKGLEYEPNLNPNRNLNLNQNLKDELDLLQSFQKHLFSMGSFYASEKQNPEYIKNIESWILTVESEIDKLTKELPELKNFILPGGAKSACLAHQARVQTRKVERDLVEFEEAFGNKEGQGAIIYLNRISDYLFTLARYLNHKLGVKELIWTSDDD